MIKHTHCPFKAETYTVLLIPLCYSIPKGTYMCYVLTCAFVNKSNQSTLTSQLMSQHLNCYQWLTQHAKMLFNVNTSTNMPTSLLTFQHLNQINQHLNHYEFFMQHANISFNINTSINMSMSQSMSTLQRRCQCINVSIKSININITINMST